MLSELTSSVQRGLVAIGTVYLIFAGAIAIILCITTFFLVRMFVNFVHFRGRHQVLCPATGSTATVRINALYAAVSGAMADPELYVSDCSLWPERRDCRRSVGYAFQFNLITPSPVGGNRDPQLDSNIEPLRLSEAEGN